MKKKLNCILLIDDDEPTNFLYKMIVSEADCTSETLIAQSASEALNYLEKFCGKNSLEDFTHFPDLIFLDINMPCMNGWEFLEKYKELKKDFKKEAIVVMLSTSLNPDDVTRAKGMPEVAGFRHKPLSIPMLNEILKEFFPADY
ncbi:MAG: response regulator [Bacteroidetes bacterium]|nr:response regulator [Bacteroidota bacterium]